jgi:hypothetical protein
MVSHTMIQARMQEEIDELRAALAQLDESFCDSHCTWHDHHPDCALAQPEPPQRKQLVPGHIHTRTPIRPNLDELLEPDKADSEGGEL